MSQTLCVRYTLDFKQWQKINEYDIVVYLALITYCLHSLIDKVETRKKMHCKKLLKVQKVRYFETGKKKYAN